MASPGANQYFQHAHNKQHARINSNRLKSISNPKHQKLENKKKKNPQKRQEPIYAPTEFA